MKCANCSIRNADEYKRISEGHPLFEILTKNNPRRIHGNVYFCDSCLKAAKLHVQPGRPPVSIPNHGVISLSANKLSTSTTSRSSISDYSDSPIIRPTHSRIDSKPCPKRFKKKPERKSNLSRLQDAEMSSSQVTSSENSECVSETEMLLNVQENMEGEGAVTTEASDLHSSIAGSLAPAPKNPRIRNVRPYFEENENVIDVNNYSRVLAG